ncbi:AAA family ATPase [Azospirillum brasilense]|uniref:AAA family ATPase n=1 Tax=Azospirillum brasilense TaxID=192 RepID=UPI001ED9F7DE|nr:AAA family ATPase [Azospirillum brasilense]UKJ74442.1 AAA family ATPase [Azospirillum brasilense]
MIENVTIKNYKSILKAEMSLGRINVFIGENGAGKSNILEAFALVGAASAGKLDNEFLASRGIRVTAPNFMRSAFTPECNKDPIEITVSNENLSHVKYIIENGNEPYANWSYSVEIGTLGAREDVEIKEGVKVTTGINKGRARDFIDKIIKERDLDIDIVIEHASVFSKALIEASRHAKSMKSNTVDGGGSKAFEIGNKNIFAEIVYEYISSESGSGLYKQILKDFIVYSPENTALRRLDPEGQIEPLGINGEGLFKLLSVLDSGPNSQVVKDINKKLNLFGWFNGFNLVSGNSGETGSLAIQDRFLSETMNVFDQRSANEGFLFLVFYFALFSTELTPRFFAIDNIDASLNPKLCQKLIRELVALSKKHDKQALLTTHNPAVLDGINLDDPDQRLFVVSRNTKGETRVRRIENKPKADGVEKVKLSEAFLRGSLGGLPRSF